MRICSLILLALLGIGLSLHGQISHGGKPLSFENTMLKKSIAEYFTPDFDYQKMKIEDEQAGRGKPYRYGKEHKVVLNPENSGTWQTLKNGDKVWQLIIKSPGAYSLSLIFDNYNLSADSKVFLYSSDRKALIGAFTDKNNKRNGWFSTVPIPGEEIVIELNVSAGKNYGKLNISGVIHDYKGAFGLKTGYGSSGSCNVNINCPEGADWQNEKRAVVKYVASGLLCTGALINNTANNGKPYLLTAHHCGASSESGASSAVFWFNYESEGCIATGNPAYQSLTGASVIATGEDTTGTHLDFTLLELSQTPPSEYKAYYAGWNRSLDAATRTVCIHHPQGDIKKISFDNDAPIIGDYQEGYLTDSHWNITEWDLGTTEGGSSGSPLFDQNHLIVGDLTGGTASCGNSIDDYYARFDLSWNHYSEPTKHLKSWLDPLNTGNEQLEGLDPNAITEGLDAEISGINSPNAVFCMENEVTPTVILHNNGTIALTSAVIGIYLDENPVEVVDWVGSLETNDTAGITFKPISFTPGSHTIKAFVTSPNSGIDEYRNNDSKVKNIYGQQLIGEVLIKGEANICFPGLKSSHQVSNEGIYLWSARGGEILESDTLQEVEIQWDDWGTRTLDVNVSNLCNSVDAETLEIDVVEQGFNLDIILDGNGETACWYLRNCDGDIVAQDCDLPATGAYTTSICMSRGCYQFEIVSEPLGVKSYTLNRMSDNQVVVSGVEVSGSQSLEFILNASTSNASINLYPNPSKTEVVVEASFVELYENSKFAIFNLKGATVMPYTLFDERKVIDISTLSSGFYIVKILTQYGEFSKKFWKP